MTAEPAEPDRSRWIVGVMIAALVATVIYVLHRAWILRVDQWDAFLYLNNTRRFLGETQAPYQLDKPPLVPALYMPVVAWTRGEPASAAMIVWPHLQAALMSFVSMGAVFLAFRWSRIDWRLALTGTLLVIGNAIFIRYAPLALTDTVAAGWVAASFALWFVARTRRRWSLFILTGLCIGLAAITRYQFVMIPFAIGTAEAIVTLRDRRVNDRRWLGLAIASALSGLFFIWAHKVAFEAIDREWSMRSLLEAIEYAGSGASREWPHEEPHHYFIMLSIVVSPLVLGASLIGLPIALWRRRPRDLLFGSWLFFMAVPLFRIDHNEVRYLYAAFPAMAYFALLPLEELLRLKRLQRWAARPLGAAALTVVGLGALGWAVWPGIDQARRDVQDPFFEEEVIRATAAWLVEHNDEELPYFWYGNTHTLHPEDVYRLVHDEFFNVFNFGPHEFEYFTGQGMPRFRWQGEDPIRPTLRQCPDGCAVVVGVFDDWNTRELIENGVPDVPVETMIISRPVRLDWRDDRWTGGDITLRPGEDGHPVPEANLGEVGLMVELNAGQDGARRVGPRVVTWTDGEPIALTVGENDDVLVYRIQRASFPQ